MTMREKFERLVFQGVVNYSRYATCERTVADAQVTLHKVGHNATHDFWIGMLPDERLVYMTVCENRHGEMCMEHVQIYPRGEHPSYIGHW